MRFFFVIAALAVIAVGLVKLRTDEIRARSEAQRAQTRLIAQREALWAQEVRLGELGAVDAVRIRAEELGIALLAPGESTPAGPNGVVAYRPR